MKFLRWTSLVMACLFEFYMPMARADGVTVLEVYRSAQTYDATLKAARQDNVAQKEEIDKSRAAFLPQVRASLYEGRASTDSQTLGRSGELRRSYDSLNYGLNVRQSIFSLANFADYAQSQAEVARSDVMLQKEELGLMGRVSGAYLDVLLAHENLAYIEAQKASVQSQLLQAEKRYAAGFGTITEINEAKANLDSVTAQGLEWENGLEFNKRVLETISGIYLKNFYKLDPVKLMLSPPEPPLVEDWIALAMLDNRDIQAANFDIDAMHQEIRKQKAGHLPTLDLVASRIKTESDNNYTVGQKFDTSSIGVQVNIPIFAGGYVSASVRQAEARFLQAEEKLTDKQRLVAKDIRKYFDEVVNGIPRIEAKSESVKSNELALDGTQKAYGAGIRSNVDVLNAQEKLFSARRELARERYKLIYNRLLLKQTAGFLNESDLAELDKVLSVN